MTLLEKLEAATEGSRELDVLLWAWEHNYEVYEDGFCNILARNRKAPSDIALLGRIDPGKHSNNFQEAKAEGSE